MLWGYFGSGSNLRFAILLLRTPGGAGAEDEATPLLRTILRSVARLSDESGSILVIAAFGMIAIVGFAALAVDVGNLRLVRRQLQMAADAAAIAGALEVIPCNGTPACSTMTSAMQGALVENGFPGSTVLTNCDTTQVAGLELMINNGPCTQPSDPNANNLNYIEVVLSEPAPVYFAKVLGFSSMPIVVRAEAARSNPYCTYVLDKTGSNAATVTSGATFDTTCGMVVESNSSTSVACTNGTVNASFVGLVGTGTSSGCTIHASVLIGMKVPTPSDPLANLAKPPVPACGSSTSSPYHGSASALTIAGTATLYGDYAYCGGITIQNGANVSFQPGTYVLTSTNGGAPANPGGLTMQIGATISGTGVTFYNFGPSGGINMSYVANAGSITLSAPTTGSYSGMLFLQDPANTTAATITGADIWNTSLTGTYYFPTAKVTYSYDGTVPYNLLVAYDITFAEASSSQGVTHSAAAQNNNYSILYDNGPPTGDRIRAGAVMVTSMFRMALANEEGSSLVEVALVLPIMLLLLVGSVDFGRAYYAEMEVSSAASAGAIYGVQQPADTAGMKAAAVLSAGDVTGLSATGSTGCECSDGTSASPNCAATPTCSANVVNYVQVTTSVTFTPTLRYPGIPATISLQGFARMRTAF